MASLKYEELGIKTNMPLIVWVHSPITPRKGNNLKKQFAISQEKTSSLHKPTTAIGNDGHIGEPGTMEIATPTVEFGAAGQRKGVVHLRSQGV
eukprot:scaffold60711_cov65-Attheya_sp.AAC.7